MEKPGRLTPKASMLSWHVVFILSTDIGRRLCHWYQNFPIGASSCIYPEACVRSKTPVVWAGFLAAQQSLIPNIVANSDYTSEKCSSSFCRGWCSQWMKVYYVSCD